LATLLIVDDSDRARSQIRDAVSAAALFDTVLEASDGIHGLKLILSEKLDVVVCDLHMPGFDGEKLLRAKASNPGGSNLPFIVVTASEDLNRRTRLLERGASDVITKPFHPRDLVARLHLHLKVKKLQDELIDKNETLARLSTSDPVTGLRTRRYISDVLSIEFQRARRYQTPLSVIMADLDHFKKVNDTYGHLAGDAVLFGVSDLLLSELRATDVAGRYGGEEILVVLHHSEPKGAAIFGERWREAVEQEPFASPDGRKIQVEISMGVAEFRPEMETPDGLIAAADEALYRAKDRGRNQVAVYSAIRRASRR